MDSVLTILFICFIVTFIPGNLMIFVFKKPEVSFREIFMLGSFVVFHLDKYVEFERISQIILLLKIGMAFFCLFILVGIGYALS